MFAAIDKPALLFALRPAAALAMAALVLVIFEVGLFCLFNGV